MMRQTDKKKDYFKSLLLKEVLQPTESQGVLSFFRTVETHVKAFFATLHVIQ